MMIRIFDRPVDEDLLPFSAFLWQQQIPHKITEEGGRQVLWLAHGEHRDVVLNWFDDWQSGLLQLGKAKVSWGLGRGTGSGPLADWRRIPVTMLLLALCLIVAVLTNLGKDFQTVAWFTISDFAISGDYLHYQALAATLEQGQFWRVATPMFLHFGIFHLVFNMLWLMDLGRRIELLHRGPFLLLLVLLTGVTSNVVQCLAMDGNPLFGGMSGAIYGLLGFCWIRERVAPNTYRIPPGVYIFMLAWLAIGFTGILGSLGLGEVANGAHFGGLLSGVVFGWIYNRFFNRG